MPAHIYFDEQKRYIIYTISDPIDIPALNEIYAQEQVFRDSTPHTVHMLVDLSQAHQLPENWLNAKATPGLKHPNSGYMLIAGMTSGIRLAVEVVARIARFNRLIFFATREEAELKLQELLQDTLA